MADANDNRKKRKKKHKKHAKSSAEEPGSGAFESADTSASQNDKSGTAQQSPVVVKQEASSPIETKLAAKPQSSNREWSHDEENLLLRNVKEYASKLRGKQQHKNRVEWSQVEQVNDFSQFEMEARYKTLTKNVRKVRSALEVVEDALKLHKEERKLPSWNRQSSQPPNAFSMFCKAKRASLTEKYPELKFTQIHKKLCERWKQLSDEKREKYLSKAAKAKSEYYEERRKQQISELKPPMTAFDLWKSERLDDDDIDGDETENDFVVQWENLPKSTKKGWVQAAASERERYDTEVKNITRKGKQTTKSSKQAVKLKPPEESATDEHQQSSSSLDKSGSKRKPKSPPQAVKSPVKKAKNEKSGDSKEGNSSSDED